MRHLQINEGLRGEDDLEQSGANVVELEVTGFPWQRSALYEGLRQRDAWLRKPWGKRFVAPELQ